MRRSRARRILDLTRASVVVPRDPARLCTRFVRALPVRMRMAHVHAEHDRRGDDVEAVQRPDGTHGKAEDVEGMHHIAEVCQQQIAQAVRVEVTSPYGLDDHRQHAADEDHGGERSRQKGQVEIHGLGRFPDRSSMSRSTLGVRDPFHIGRSSHLRRWRMGHSPQSVIGHRPDAIPCSCAHAAAAVRDETPILAKMFDR